MAALSDARLYATLQHELGLSHDTQVERELKAVTFAGDVLDIPSWVTFKTAWSEVLDRVTVSGTLLPRRMSELFRNAIPDEYVVDWLAARKHPSWEQAYEAIINALNDPKWHTCYAKDLRTRVGSTAKPPSSKQAPAAPASQSPAQPAQSDKRDSKQNDKGNKATSKSAEKEQGKFEPVGYKNSYGNVNVNPNYKPNLNDNPKKIACTRCIDYVHKWTSDLCTTPKRHDGTLVEPALSAPETAERLLGRWNRGFFFSEELKTYKSPSAQDSSTAAATAAAQINKRK